MLVVDTWKLEYLQNPERMIMVELLTNRDLDLISELRNVVGENAKQLLDEYINNINEDDLRIEKILKRSVKAINTLKDNSNDAKYASLLDELAFDTLDENVLTQLKVDIIIFDELDRVLPETFIEIIKFMKYFINNNNNLSIAAALNLEQCNSMIKHLYGEHFSSEVYFDKVFKQELEIINYYEEKARYIYNLIDMPDKNDWDRRYTIQQTICNYFSRGLRDVKGNVGFGFKAMELRDISSFVLNELRDLKQEVWWHSNDYEKNLIKVMIIFYLMYNAKYYKNINDIIFEELHNVDIFPYKFRDENIDIPCDIVEEHVNIINSFNKIQSNKDIADLFISIGDIY